MPPLPNGLQATDDSPFAQRSRNGRMSTGEHGTGGPRPRQGCVRPLRRRPKCRIGRGGGSGSPAWRGELKKRQLTLATGPSGGYVRFVVPGGHIAKGGKSEGVGSSRPLRHSSSPQPMSALAAEASQPLRRVGVVRRWAPVHDACTSRRAVPPKGVNASGGRETATGTANGTMWHTLTDFQVARCGSDQQSTLNPTGEACPCSSSSSRA